MLWGLEVQTRMHGHFIRFRLQKILFKQLCSSSFEVSSQPLLLSFLLCSLLSMFYNYFVFLPLISLLFFLFFIFVVFSQFQLLVRVYDHMLDVLNVIWDGCFLIGLFSFIFCIFLVWRCLIFFFLLSFVDIVFFSLSAVKFLFENWAIIQFSFYIGLILFNHFTLQSI